MRAWLSQLFSHFSSRGLGLIELMVALGVSGVVVLAANEFIVRQTGLASEAEQNVWLSQRRTEIQMFLHSATGWSETVALNPELACFTSASGCPPGVAPQPLKIPIQPSVTLDGTNARTGLSRTGDYCTTFNESLGSFRCPIGLSIMWEALCDSSTSCPHPQPKITVQFRIKRPGSSLQALKSYDLVVFKDPKLDTINDVCTALGGVLAGTTCTMPNLSEVCDPATGQLVLGFDSVGKVICGQPALGNCPAGQVLKGFDAGGNKICSAGCP